MIKGQLGLLILMGTMSDPMAIQPTDLVAIEQVKTPIGAEPTDKDLMKIEREVVQLKLFSEELAA